MRWIRGRAPFEDLPHLDPAVTLLELDRLNA
jgi:hypothetical protein